MGHTTDFEGEFTLDKPLTKPHADYLRKFMETRRMKRDEAITSKRPDLIREAVGLPVGKEGCYFVGEGGCCGQGEEYKPAPGEEWSRQAHDAHRASFGILDFNNEPAGQPGLWNQWEPNEDGTRIRWNGGETFYNYIEWLKYIIEHFLKPWGYTLNGEVNWYGESRDDAGIIICKDNVVTTKTAHITYR